MERSLRPHSDIFKMRAFNQEFDFVYVTQALEDLEETSGGVFPCDQYYLEQTDLIWMLTPELLHLVDLYRNAASIALPSKVQKKYRSSIRMYEKQYPRITSFLKASDFCIEEICPGAFWSKVIARHPESMSHAIKSLTEF